MKDLFGNEKMLALSWKQPFGSAMLIGKNETRVWNTRYRGLVLICNSQVGYGIAAIKAITGERQYTRLMEALVPVWQMINMHGYAIAVGNLFLSRPMTPADEDKTFVQYREPWVEERKAKDGRIRKIKMRLYVHQYENVRCIEPIPWKGCQGWKEVPDDIKKKIKFI